MADLLLTKTISHTPEVISSTYGSTLSSGTFSRVARYLASGSLNFTFTLYNKMGDTLMITKLLILSKLTMVSSKLAFMVKGLITTTHLCEHENYGYNPNMAF